MYLHLYVVLFGREKMSSKGPLLSILFVIMCQLNFMFGYSTNSAKIVNYEI